MKWFRLWVEWANDPKVQLMPEHMQRRHVMLLCLRRWGDTSVYDDSEIARYMNISLEEVQKTKELFQKRDFIDNGWNVLAWGKRQFESDSSTKRVRKHREKKKRSSNVSETPPDTETDTETDTENTINGFVTQAEFIYSYYPRKIQKNHAIKKILARLRAGASFSDLLQATRNYSELVKEEKKKAKWILYGRTFYGVNEPWKDYLHRKVKCSSCGKERLEADLDESRACKEGC